LAERSLDSLSADLRQLSLIFARGLPEAHDLAVSADRLLTWHTKAGLVVTTNPALTCTFFSSGGRI
jgi:hypothetical protein